MNITKNKVLIVYLKITNVFYQFRELPKYTGSNSLIFCPFLACKILVTKPGSPILGLHKAFISTRFVSKFQLCTSSGFWVISELKNFQAKNRRFICFFVSQFTITWPRIPKISSYDVHSNYHVESKFQASRFNLLLAILICQNSLSKTQVLRARAKSQ